MFSIIFFRLWYLQVLSGDKYLKQAQNNQVREMTVQAPRGQILDRNGKVLVDNRTALALQLQPTELPQPRRKRSEEFARLGQVIGMSPDGIQKQLRQQTKDLPANPVTLKRDVDYDLVYYLRENQAKYPGVSVQKVYVRNYPDGGPGGADLRLRPRGHRASSSRSPATRASQPGDQVGQSGVENTYDNVLRGTNGMTRGSGRRRRASRRAGCSARRSRRPGDNLLLASTARSRARGRGGDRGLLQHPGAFVAMNVQERRDPRARLLAHLRPLGVHEAGASRSDVRADHLADTPARRSPTARSRASIRRDRPSSRSPRSRPWRAGR